MARISRYLLICGLGGLIGWAVVEPFDYLTPSANISMSYGQILLLGALIGLFIGLALGFAEAMSGVSPRDGFKGLLIGTAVGIGGGAIGLAFGNAVYNALGGMVDAPQTGPMSMGQFIVVLIGRSAGWGLFGGMLGLSQGLAAESSKKITNGAVGGLIGGCAGGFVFQVLSSLNTSGVLAFPGWFLRLVGITATAATIGFFVALVEEFTKQAWLVKVIGRNEGKEFLIYKTESVAGRDELADIPVFTDPDVESKHFVIKCDGRKYTIQDLGTSAGTFLNGNKVTKPEVLRDADIIQIGMTKFRFRDKATKARDAVAGSTYLSGSRIPVSDNVCQFCGVIKDVSGNCQCTIGSAPPPMQTQQATVVQPQPPTQAYQQPLGQTVPMSGAFTPPSAAGAKLVGLAGPYQGQTYNLVAGVEVTIGRQSDRSIPLPTDNTVSRQHARVVEEMGQFVVYDMGSANGTYVNGTRIIRQPLNAGDVVQIGSTKFRYEQ